MSSTTHLIQLSIDMDDGRIKDIVERQASEQIIKHMRQEIEKTLFSHRGWQSEATDPRRRDGYSDYVETVFKEFLEKNREDILDRAAAKLVESVKRTKAFKEKVTNILEGEI